MYKPPASSSLSAAHVSALEVLPKIRFERHHRNQTVPFPNLCLPEYQHFVSGLPVPIRHTRYLQYQFGIKGVLCFEEGSC